MELIPKHFDRDHSLAELLSSVAKPKLDAALRQLLGMPYRLIGANGECMAGDPALEMPAARFPVSHELEPVGYLEIHGANESDRVRARGAAMLLELLAHGGARYFMASSLHLEAVHADHEALQQKHFALQASENRYRELAASLESEVERQIAVIETAQRQLYETEKLASVGQLAAGVAHEINNPIGFIRSNLCTAKAYVDRLHRLAEEVRRCSDDAVRQHWKQADYDFMLEDFPPLMDECIHGADRVARIVADLKEFSNVDLAQTRAADLNEQLRMAVEMARMAYPPSVSVVMQLTPLPLVACQISRINQALLNVLHNAGQALASGSGTLTVSSACVDERIVLCVRDDGAGMAPEVMARAFEPFFTTRDVGKGTGLGLTVARDVVRSHGGDIALESAPGKGTSVTITLPLARASV